MLEKFMVRGDARQALRAERAAVRCEPPERVLVRALQLAAVIAIGCLAAACAVNPSGSYSFQTELERQPLAFQNMSAGEPLTVALKLQNLSDQPILIAGADSAKSGLRLRATIGNQPVYLGPPSVVVGYRAGARLLKASESSGTLWYDRHASAVDDLARVGPVLLHIDADQTRSSLGLLANEAGYSIIIPVDWTKVSFASGQIVKVEFDLSLEIFYTGKDQKSFQFPGKLQRRIEGYLVQASRFPSGTIAAPNGPISGSFSPN